MKTNKLFIAALTAMTLFSCNKVNNGKNDPVITGEAYLAISLNSGTSTKTNSTDNGTVAESKATSVDILAFDVNEVCLGVVAVTGATIGNTDGSGNAAAAKAFSVPAGTEKVFVVINKNAKWDVAEAAIKGLKWSAINATIDAATADITVAEKFMMVNRGALSGSPMTDAAKGLVDVKNAVKKTESEALTAAVSITVDRLAAKISLTAVDTDIAVSPTGSKFTFNAWALNTVNKKATMYTNLVEYANASATTVQGLYRMDANYTGHAGMTDATAIRTFLTENYTAIDEAAVTLATNNAVYCLENTMAAADQLRGFTTKAVVKGQYTPSAITTEKDSYFSYNGDYISKTAMAAAYKANAGLKADIVAFLNAAQTLPTSTDTEIDAAITALDATHGIKSGVKKMAVRYFHEAVSYYEALIRHDQNVTTKMALGRYGVVRNNAYNLTVNSVSGPGTPWIPDPTDPEDPTNPTDPDDELDAFLAVSISVAPWTVWSQGVDL